MTGRILDPAEGRRKPITGALKILNEAAAIMQKGPGYSCQTVVLHSRFH